MRAARAARAWALVSMVGCVPWDADQILADPSTVIDDDGTLRRVQIIGELGPFHVGTRNGWGTARAWTSAETGKTGFTIDVRGMGRGFVMSRAKVEGIDFSALSLGDELNIDGLEQNPWPIAGDGLGCGGHEEDYWDYEYHHFSGTLTVTDQDEDSTTVLMELGFSDHWTQAALRLPTTLPVMD